ncbi:ferric reductase-like transmembrane domain-containing protein [Ferrimonas balearica]|uniref:ferric reductase-like transmembrane domain-containing protein n=1 Tax=Ferrimonas balearica TaxID=44012 RepID=UPI001C9414E7|nr:ferric reductase-like transmembrane domain-containing protein [Ferrimonas balearica]MBY6106383.1 ferric reductase-like transmembrane domain-containing protein [Ferrimonas balearica]
MESNNRLFNILSTFIAISFVVLCLDYINGINYDIDRAVISLTGYLSLFFLVTSLITMSKSVAILDVFSGNGSFSKYHKRLSSIAVATCIIHWGSSLAFGGKGYDYFQYAFDNNIVNVAIKSADVIFKAFIILVVISFWKKVSYQTFRRTHKLFPVVSIIFFIHSMILIEVSQWNNGLGYFALLFGVAGILLCIKLIFDHVFGKNQYLGTVTQVEPIVKGRIIKLEIDVERWPGHDVGQYASFRFGLIGAEHPFTIINHHLGDDGKRVCFLIKSRGKGTKVIVENIKVGDKVTIGDPKGKTPINFSSHHQNWFAAGIGITPYLSFIDKIKHDQCYRHSISFTVVINESDIELADFVRAFVKSLCIDLKIIVTDEGNRFEHRKFIDSIENPFKYQYVLCGPESLIKDIEYGLCSVGVHRGSIHMEGSISR